MSKKDVITAFEKLSDRIEASGLRDYMEASGSPWSIIWRNFLAGIARGVGLTLGATVVVALIVKMTYGVIRMNIPYLTGILNDFVMMVKNFK